MTLSIIIPAHNEESNIQNVIEDIEKKVRLDHKIVVIDDHSTDKTADLVMELASKYKNKIILKKSLLQPGFANALKTGFENADSDFIIPVMADSCDDALTINKMYQKALEGYDIVCGSRYMKEGKKIGGPKIKTFFSLFVSKTLNKLINIPTQDISNSFKLYRKRVIRNIHIESKGFEISVEVPLRAFFAGYKITEVPTTWIDRKKGKSKFSVFKEGSGYVKLYLWCLWKRIPC